MLDEEHSVKEAILAIGSWPEDIDAIFANPAPLPASDTERLFQAPMSFSAPAGASYPITPLAVVTVASDQGKVGNQPSRAAHLIFQGVKPADLPVETADFLVTLNLKTVQAIGLTVPDDLPAKADTITRESFAAATNPEGDCRFQGPGCVERSIGWVIVSAGE